MRITDVNSLYWKQRCWTADEVWYPYFAKTGTWNFFGVKEATSLAHRRVSLWTKPPGRGLAPARLEGAGLERPGEGVVEGTELGHP